MANKTTQNLENDIDALFALPLVEFTPARNALAVRLKKDGMKEEADRIKSLAKPSVSAWAVNQLYWKNRETFERLIAAGKEFRKAQAAQLAGKVTDTRGTGQARKEAVSNLSRLAAALLRDAGHTPSPETMRRIGMTLEAMSAYASVPGTPPPGRLTEDVDAPGFDALTALFTPAAVRPSQTASPKEPAKGRGHSAEEARRTQIADAKSSLREAERSLTAAQAEARNVQAALKKADADAKKAEKSKREVEERLRKASAAAEEAARRLRTTQEEAERAIKAVEKATRAVQEASLDLQRLNSAAEG